MDMTKEYDDSTIKDFLAGKEAERDVNGNGVFVTPDGHPYVQIDKYTLSADDYWRWESEDDCYSSHDQYPDLLRKVKYKKSYALAVDGDDEESAMQSEDEDGVLVVSFVCLAKLCGIIGLLEEELYDREVIKLLDKAELIAFTPQEFIELSKKEKRIATDRLVNAERKLNGYNLTWHGGTRRWHRPSSCVFKFDKKYFVMGIDEGSYFGCELPAGCKPKTVAEALEMLAPAGIKNRKAVRRQGEWFVYQVDAAPELKDCLCIGNDGQLILAPDTEESNFHRICAGDESDIRVSKNGVYARNFYLEHDQHETIRDGSGKWCRFERNTAVQSVSQEGVD